ncbi:hypothetical protein EHS15_09185 [Leptospira idonii]|uniref:Tetratricopeptide repeat protein n=2 Tax=Leptospira idonii TaxID=1193500 RepID=A0A4R9LYS6_9LEPT|nr:hypothetical protein [Leptospira idonii]TGN19493.1 hypothetical protein EHS15_09185 [Leptospira idonii]
MRLFPNRFVYFFVILLFPLWAGEEDRRNPLSGLYMNPLQVISPEELAQLDSEKRIPIDEDSGIALRPVVVPTATTDPNEPENPATPVVEGTTSLTDNPTEEAMETGPKSVETKIREAEGLLKRYYSQFIEEKRIWEDREKGNIYSSRSDSNDIRLLLWESTHKHSETYIVRDSPVLYQLHIRLAKLYAESEKYAPSLRHYLAAFRYHPLDQTEVMFRDGEWQKEDYQSLFVGSALEHKQVWANKEKAEKEYKQAKDELHLSSARSARSGKSPSEIRIEEALQEEIVRSRERNLKTAIQNYETSLQTRYLPYLNQKQQSDSQTLYAMANVVKKIEDDNKERLKIINKLGVAGKGIYVLFDYKRNTDFFAYELLLEKAYSVWPENPQVIFDVAEQYRQDGKKEKAADFYEKYLTLLLKVNPLDETQKQNLISTYLRLATINADLKRKVIAGNYYEKFFQTSPDNSEKTRVSFEMGVFFATGIGDLKKGGEFLTYWLDRNSKDWNPGLEQTSNLEDLESIAFYHLSRKDKWMRNWEAERNKLNLAYSQWKKLETQHIAAEKELEELKAKKQKVKRDLLITTEDDALSQYRLMDIKIEDQEARVRVLKTKLDKVPVLKLLFRLGVLSEQYRDFQKALGYYDLVIELGGEVEIQLALKEKRRVEKILTNGVVVPPFSESI